MCVCRYILPEDFPSLRFLIVWLGILTSYCDTGYVGKKEGEDADGPASFNHLVNLVVKPLILYIRWIRGVAVPTVLLLLEPLLLARWCWHRSLCDPTDIAFV